MNAKIESGQILAPLVEAIRKDIDIELNGIDAEYWSENLSEVPTAEWVAKRFVVEGFHDDENEFLDDFSSDAIFYRTPERESSTLGLLRQACEAADEHLLTRPRYAFDGELRTDAMASDMTWYMGLGISSLSYFARWRSRAICKDEATVLAGLAAFWRVLGIDETDSKGEPILS